MLIHQLDQVDSPIIISWRPGRRSLWLAFLPRRIEKLKHTHSMCCVCALCSQGVTLALAKFYCQTKDTDTEYVGFRFTCISALEWLVSSYHWSKLNRRIASKGDWMTMRPAVLCIEYNRLLRMNIPWNHSTSAVHSLLSNHVLLSLANSVIQPPTPSTAISQSPHSRDTLNSWD